MNSSVLPFSIEDVDDTSKRVSIKLAELVGMLTKLSSFRVQYTIADHEQKDAKRDAYLVLIRETLKDIRTIHMDYQQAYFNLMSKCNEL